MPYGGVEHGLSRTIRRLPLLLWLMFDERLRHRQGVGEFSADERCIFRIQLDRSDRALTLCDRTHARFGARVLALHIWNEHLPVLDPTSLRWARDFHDRLDLSLGELHRFLQRRDDLDDVRVIRADMAFGTARQSDQLARIAARYGFERIVDARPLTLGQKAHRLGENIYISLLVLARNGSALRRDTLRRERTPVFLSRRRLASRYADVAATSQRLAS